MTNQEIAKIFQDIAVRLEMDDIAFKPQAYETAALSLEELSEDIDIFYQKNGLKGLKGLPGIGENIAKKIIELIETGKCKEYEKMKKKMPVEVMELVAVEGMGPKTIKKFWQELKIKNLKDLKKAAQAKKIQKLPGFGENREQSILRGIKFVQKTEGRFVLGFVLPTMQLIQQRLKNLPYTKKVEIAGSVRRMKETIGDGDFLVTTNKPEEVIDYFVKMHEVAHVYAKGKTKALVRLSSGMDLDLRVVRPEVFGSALQYFTGNKEHNIKVRKLAIQKKYKLNEYGLFKGKKLIAGKTEREIYQKLGMQYPEPELRTNSGEVEAALENKLPKLIGYGEIKGDLQMHSNYSDGQASIKEMAEAAKKLGYQYIAVTDHSQSLHIANGLNEKRLKKQWQEIDKINKKIKGIKVLKGIEADILKDGSLDYKNKILAKFDIVVAAIHSNFKMSKLEMTQRIIKALQNNFVHILAHPTGRLIQRRDAYQIDLDKIIAVAKKYKKILEIDASPDRLDLSDEDARKAKEMGVKLAINTDAHSPGQLQYMPFGIAQARRGWLEKKDVINTKILKELLKML